MGETTEVLDEETPSEEEPSSEEEETPAADSEDISEYEFKVDGKAVKMPIEEVERFYRDWRNETKWQSKLHEKGENLNRLRDSLQARETEIKQNQDALGEWQKLRKAIEANPEAYKLMNKLLNENEPTLNPAYKELEKKTEQLSRQYENDKADVDLGKQYEDYESQRIEDFVKDFNMNKAKDVRLFSYLAWKGSQLDDLIYEARAKVVQDAKKKKGIPPTGKKEGIKKPEFSTVEEMGKAAKQALLRGESLI